MVGHMSLTPAERAVLDERLRREVRSALADGATPDEITFLLTRMLPELGGREETIGHVAAAFDLAGKKGLRRGDHRCPRCGVDAVDDPGHNFSSNGRCRS
jgi:hypothetical protein